MERCWHENPDFRPEFENIRQRLQNFIEDEVCGVNVYSDCQKASKVLFMSVFFFFGVYLNSHIIA